MRNELEVMVRGLISTWDSKSPYRLSLCLLLDEWKRKEALTNVKVKSEDENKSVKRTSFSYVAKYGLTPTKVGEKCRPYMPPRVVTATDAEVLSNSQAEERQLDESSIKLPPKCYRSVPWKEEHSQGVDLKDDSNVTKVCPKVRQANKSQGKEEPEEFKSMELQSEDTSRNVFKSIKSDAVSILLDKIGIEENLSCKANKSQVKDEPEEFKSMVLQSEDTSRNKLPLPAPIKIPEAQLKTPPTINKSTGLPFAWKKEVRRHGIGEKCFTSSGKC